MKNTTFIYSLSEPETGQIRYVGKSDNPAYRAKTHLRKEDTHKSKWVQGLIERGLKPALDILDEVPQKEWEFWEQHWVQVISGWGFQLVNGDRGGLGHHRMTTELAQKISKALIGKPNVALAKRVFSYFVDGAFSQEYESVSQASLILTGDVQAHANIVRAISKKRAAYGLLWSYEKFSHIEPIHINGRIPISEETRKKISSSSLGRGVGRVVSTETRMKQRQAKLGRSPANKGATLSEELRSKMRENSKSSKRVNQYSLDGKLICQWLSVKHAAESTGASRAAIHKCALGQYSQSAGYIWKYEQPC